MSAIEVRPALLEFAKSMELELQRNEQEKGESWKDEDPVWHFLRLQGELDELQDALLTKDFDATKECLDAANYAFFIWWLVIDSVQRKNKIRRPEWME